MSRRLTDASAADDTSPGINVTPLVDVTLVLLIIFMVTAKMVASRALPLDLPRGSPSQEIQLIVGVELRANGDILVDDNRLPNDEAVLSAAREVSAKHQQLRAVIRADPAVEHGRVIRVLDLLQQGGITKIAFTAPAAAPAAAGGLLDRP